MLRGVRDPHDGHNVVFHEFAHHLDGIDGDVDGTPPLESRQQYRTWDRVLVHEYRWLVREAGAGAATLLDHYGATNEAEFFAVATECFFECGPQLRERHPELYEILRGFYRQDTAARDKPPAAALPPRRTPTSARRNKATRKAGGGVKPQTAHGAGCRQGRRGKTGIRLLVGVHVADDTVGRREAS